MNPVDLMKVADLAAQLGRILEVNPVFKDDYVIFDDEPLAMVLNLDSGCWKIATGDFGVLTLPKRATALMAGMSELVKGEEE